MVEEHLEDADDPTVVALRDRDGRASGLPSGVGGVTYAIEVGKGTVEMITGPCSDLHALRAANDAGMRALVAAARANDARVLGYGIQPGTPPTRALMTARPRYGNLLAQIGDPWLWFAVTASDQVAPHATSECRSTRLCAHTRVTPRPAQTRETHGAGAHRCRA